MLHDLVPPHFMFCSTLYILPSWSPRVTLQCIWVTHITTYKAEKRLFHKHAEAQLKKVRAYKKKTKVKRVGINGVLYLFLPENFWIPPIWRTRFPACVPTRWAYGVNRSLENPRIPALPQDAISRSHWRPAVSMALSSAWVPSLMKLSKL